MHSLATLDHRFLWHPFTQMRDWLKHEPVVIVRGQGAVLQDVSGRKYLDANSSIWTNLHGHNHPRINAAIRKQLSRIAHSSALGFANEPASLLAEALVLVANTASLCPNLSLKTVTASPPCKSPAETADEPAGGPALKKVFFSDDGSTALEVALKLAFEFSRRTGFSRRPRFLGLEGAYHGDTVGAVSLGHIDLFHNAYSALLFKTDKVMAPYCYRCPFNRAKPERADAREYRRCNWECVDRVEQKFATQRRKGNPYAAFVFEPLMQGAAGMIPQPPGWLRRVCQIARGFGALLIADEVMTAFGRTGSGTTAVPRAASSTQLPGAVGPKASHEARGGHSSHSSPLLIASFQESVRPDFLALAKGLTGGYLPMAATLTTQTIFDAFLGEYEEFKTFFHGHSFTGNQVGAAAGLASIKILQSATCIRARRVLEQALHNELKGLWQHPQVGDLRQVGLVVGVELVKDWPTRQPYELRERAGIRVCEAMAQRGVLTRPVGNVIVLMPPYCTTVAQVRQMVAALSDSITQELGTVGVPPLGGRALNRSESRRFRHFTA
jgi:adenosylmethionine-8-amino-7-oxononanoate aminotransferase